LLGFLEAFFHLAVCRAMVFALLNMMATSLSKSVGMAIALPLARIKNLNIIECMPKEKNMKLYLDSSIVSILRKVDLIKFKVTSLKINS